MDNEEEKKSKFDSYYNRDAKIEVNGKEYKIEESDIQNLNSSKLNYWHEKTRPSTWLTTSLVELIQQKFGNELKEDQIVDLASQILNTNADDLHHALDWNAQYVGWHDGVPPEDYHPFKHLKS